MFYQNADCVVLCYDMTDPETFNKLTFWEGEVAEVVDTLDTVFALCACKSDLHDKQTVSTKKAYSYIKERDSLNQAKFYETSAKMDKGIDFLFKDLAKTLYEKRRPRRTDSVPLSRCSSIVTDKGNSWLCKFRCC